MTFTFSSEKRTPKGGDWGWDWRLGTMHEGESERGLKEKGVDTQEGEQVWGSL